MKLRKLSHSPSGVALIIVLGFLVILSALAVAFFSSISTELKASRNFAAGVTTKQLSDSAVNIVMGQIAAAATRGIDGTGRGTECWASQPGMIRVYGASGGGAASTADAFYKLYSSSKMILTVANGDIGAFNVKDYTSPYTDAYAQWDTAPALWTDLNAPIMVTDTTAGPGAPLVPRFPVVDPRAFAVPGNTSGTWNGNVEGFTYDTTVGMDGMVGAGNGNAQRLPMPVRWLYVLQDGTVVAPDTGGTTTATFTNAVGPTGAPLISATNQIVGRIAFWTDDETCKLNLNTAVGFSENLSTLATSNATGYQSNTNMYPGSYWDTPRYYTQFDYGRPDINGMPQTGNVASGGLALCQLLEFEFQRYPGHPATTSLAPVLKNILSSDQMYAISPRYSNLNLQSVAASTMGGANRITVDNTQNALDNKEIQPKQDRFYASTDEFLFGAHTTGGIGYNSPGYLRSTNNQYGHFPSALITPQLIDQWRFFLTSQGRSPELNLYGQPRIACWPVRSELNSANPTGLNVYDNLMLFCSTIGSFAAANSTTTGRPDTQTNYATEGLYRYIFTRKETSIVPSTSTGSTPSACSPYCSQITHTSPYSGGATQIQWEFKNTWVPDTDLPTLNSNSTVSRNRYLLGTYLPWFLTHPIPGLGKAFDINNGGKYDGYDQQNILVEIFDYIRMANSHDTTTTISAGLPTPFAIRGTVPPSKPSYLQYNGTYAKGFGRVGTLSEVSIVFYYAGPQMEPAQGFLPLDNKGATINGAYANNTGWSKWDPQTAGNLYKSRYAKVTTTDKNGKPMLPQVTGGYMRAFLLFSTFDPMQGYAPKTDPGYSDPKMTIECQWPSGDWGVHINAYNGPTYANDFKMGFLTSAGTTLPNSTIFSTTINRSGIAYWGGRHVGGYEGFMHTLNGGPINPANAASPNAPTMHSADYWVAPYKIMWDPATPLLNTDVGLTQGGIPAAYGGSPTTLYTNSSPFTSITSNTVSNTVGVAWANLGQPIEEYYPFQTPATLATSSTGGAIPIPGPGDFVYNNPGGSAGVYDSSNTFNFSGGNLQVKLFYGSSSQTAASNPNTPALQALQTFNLTFPPANNWPIPQGPPQASNPITTGLNYSTSSASPQNPPTADVTTWELVPRSNPATTAGSFFGTDPSAANQQQGMHTWYWTSDGTFLSNVAGNLFRLKTAAFPSGVGLGPYEFDTSLQASWSFATRLAWCTAPEKPFPYPVITNYNDSTTNEGASYDPYTNSSNQAISPGYFNDHWRCIVQPGDTIRSLIYWTGENASGGPLTGSQPTYGGDLRVGQLTTNVSTANNPPDFAPHPDYARNTTPVGTIFSPSRACVLRGGDGTPYFPVGNVNAVSSPNSSNQLVDNAVGGAPAFQLFNSPDPTQEARLGNHVTIQSPWNFSTGQAFANLPWSGGATSGNSGNHPLSMVNGVNRKDNGGQYPGDFDQGLGDFPDGPYLNKQDEGNVIYRYFDNNLQQYVYPVPYFTHTWSYEQPGNTFTSPARQMPSPAMFGSLPAQPTGANGTTRNPWQTLCFSPNPAGTNHPGNSIDPKDHYLLDLFMSPIVEPYPISEPFSTAGKVNLNYRIAPFDYIRRSTALRGALYASRVTAIPSVGVGAIPAPNSIFREYKVGTLTNTGGTTYDPNLPTYPAIGYGVLPLQINYRYKVDRDTTIQSFDGQYDLGVGNPDIGFFKSATQICERWLYPGYGAPNVPGYSGTSGEDSLMRSWWTQNGDLTGDNEREKPYVDLLPRVTTKSNTFTVHVRVQTLRQLPKPAGTSYASWTEGKDQILGEYRGASTIERYIDQADKRFVPGASNTIIPDTQSCEPLYRFRVVVNKKFSP